jgi:hypothetical protein
MAASMAHAVVCGDVTISIVVSRKNLPKSVGSIVFKDKVAERIYDGHTSIRFLVDVSARKRDIFTVHPMDFPPSLLEYAYDLYKVKKKDHTPLVVKDCDTYYKRLLILHTFPSVINTEITEFERILWRRESTLREEAKRVGMKISKDNYVRRTTVAALLKAKCLPITFKLSADADRESTELAEMADEDEIDKRFGDILDYGEYTGSSE